MEQPRPLLRRGGGGDAYEYLDFAQTFKEGYFAFQQHDPGSKVSIRKVEVMPLGN